MAVRTATNLKKQRVANGRSSQVVIRRWRIYSILIVCMLMVVWVTVRLVDLQVMQHKHLSAMARGEITKEIILQPDRGIITDHLGNTLAMDVERQSLWVNPSQIAADKAPRLALTLATLLNQDMEQVLDVLTNQSLRWALVSRWLDPTVADQIAELNEPGLYLVYEPRRVYPQKTFAAHIIGSVNNNGDGISGVESFYNTQLKGVTGTLEAEFDSLQNPIAIAPQESRPARDGVNLKLTIDPLVQTVIETELKSIVEKYHAEGGTIIVLEPSTGAIRAMASLPSFDPNRYGDYPPEIYGRNPAISSVYEPGSTFKPFVVAAGLQTRSFTADTQVHDPGVINRYDVQIHNWNSMGNGMITPGEMLYYSSNVGAVQFNELTGPDKFYSFAHDFGFGASTGVDLGGEEQGIVYNTTSPDYNDAVFLSNSYGQGIAMTPLQLVRGIAAIANDGMIMRPYIVEERCWDIQQDSGEPEQECVKTEPTPIKQVVEPGVAWTIRRMMVNAANHYAPIVWQPRNGSWADQWLVPGFEVCAKTGTASIPLSEGGYDPNDVIGSVVGFAPAEHAHYAVLVKVSRPQGDVWGLSTTVPAFYRIVEQLMRYERIAPDPGLFSPGQ